MLSCVSGGPRLMGARIVSLHGTIDARISAIRTYMMNAISSLLIISCFIGTMMLILTGGERIVESKTYVVENIVY